MTSTTGIFLILGLALGAQGQSTTTPPSGGQDAASETSASEAEPDTYPFQPVSGSWVVPFSGCVEVRAGDIAGVAGSFTPGDGLAGYRIEAFEINVSCSAAWSGSIPPMMTVSMTMTMVSPTTYCASVVGTMAGNRTMADGGTDRFNGTNALIRTDNGAAIKLGCDANCERCVTAHQVWDPVTADITVEVNASEWMPVTAGSDDDDAFPFWLPGSTLPTPVEGDCPATLPPTPSPTLSPTPRENSGGGSSSSAGSSGSDGFDIVYPPHATTGQPRRVDAGGVFAETGGTFCPGTLPPTPSPAGTGTSGAGSNSDADSDSSTASTALALAAVSTFLWVVTIIALVAKNKGCLGSRGHTHRQPTFTNPTASDHFAMDSTSA